MTIVILRNDGYMNKHFTTENWLWKEERKDDTNYHFEIEFPNYGELLFYTNEYNATKLNDALTNSAQKITFSLSKKETNIVGRYHNEAVISIEY